MSKKKKPALKEKETFKLYSERLVKKLEKKILALEKSNKRVKESKERYRTVFENTGTATVIIEENMVISMVNTRFERLSGYSKDEIENKMKWTDFVIPEDLEKMKKYHITRRKTKGKAPTEYEFQFIDKKGNIKNIFLKIDRIPGTKKSVASLMDITERKKAEQKIKHLNLVLRAVRRVNQLVVKEKNRERLLKGVCNNLIKMRSYYNAWIALLDKSGKLETYAEAGIGKAFLPMVEILKKGKLTVCGQKALKQQEVVTIKDPASTCPECPLIKQHSDRRAMTVRLEYSGKVYGFLSVSIPVHLVDDQEEQSLFKEVAGDIAFSIHNIELDEKRKQAEEDVKNAKNELQMILDSVPAIIFYKDTEGRIIRANKALADRLKVPVKDIVGKTTEELFPKEQAENMRKDDQEVMISRKPKKDIIEPYDTPEGTRWVITDKIPYKDKEGKIAGLISLSKDITELKQAEEELKIITERLELAMDAGEHGFWDWNLDTDDVYFSPRYYTMLGYKLGELPMKLETWVNLMHPEDRKTIVPKVEKHVENAEPYEVEFRLKTKGGDWKWISGRGKSFNVDKNGISHRAIGLHVDITERKKAEEKLQESEKRFQQVTKNAQEWVWEMDVNGLYTYASPVVKKILGYKPEEVVGKKHFYDLFYPEDREKLKKTVFELIGKKQSVHGFIKRNVRKDGETVWLSTSKSPILDKKGNVLGYRGVDTDITERKKTEKKLKYINLILYTIRFVNQLIVKEKDQEKLLKKVCNNLVIAPIFNNIRIAILDNSYRISKIFYSRPNKETTHKLSQLEGTKLAKAIVDILLQQEFYFAKDLSPIQRKYIPLDAKTIDETVLVPLKYAEKLYGFLSVTISEELLREKEIHSLLREVSGDISFALYNVEAEEKRVQLEEKLKENFERWQKALDGTIQAIAMIAEKRDPYTAGHQRRVGQLSSAIAQEMNLSSEKINIINMAAAIHDIGKISVPVEILVKPIKLSTIEFDIIKIHSQTGYDIVKNIEFPWPIARIILQHHERMNGSGYPNNLKGDEILLEARILGVADVVEAMSSNRPYRPALGTKKALEEIEKNKGILYEPEVVDACIKLFKEKGFKFKKEKELH